MEKLVTSLENSKKLKELGVKMAIQFTWVMSTNSEDGHKKGEYKLESFRPPFYGVVKDYYCAGADNKDFEMFSAFTATELMDMLPWNIVDKDGDDCPFDMYKMEEEYAAQYRGLFRTCVYPTPQDALSALYIYCIENKLIEI